MHAPLSFRKMGRTSRVSLRASVILVPIIFFPRLSVAQIYDFKTYSVREGMVSNSISCLCQDSEGYLWVETGDGISVYDDTTFRNYSVADGLASSLVNRIYEDVRLKGVVWTGTNGGGVSRFEAGDELKDVQLDPAITRTLLLICKEALNNSVKHSGCRTIHVRITCPGKRIKMLLSDDGRGFDNMRTQAASAGGKFALRSNLPGGTVVEVELPASR